MANQIITNYCNANCSFCFAADSRSRMLREGSLQMDKTEFRSWLDFTLRAGISELRLLGGEPTLHPDFPEFVKVGREAGCSILVFSNGVMPEESRNALAALDPEVCTVVVNMSADIRKDDFDSRMKTLQMLGLRIKLGYTLVSPDFSLSVAAAFIQVFNLRKSIRLGLSHPTWRGENQALHPKRYPVIGQRIFEESFRTARFGIRLEADCGFVRCMFGQNFSRLKENGFDYISCCTPVIDQCTGGKILPCFALSNFHALDRDDFSDAKGAFDRMTELLQPYHSFGIYPECSSCVYFEANECCGGCMAARLRRLQPGGRMP